MASQLFLHETSRRVRAEREGIVDDYLLQRPGWMSAFNLPSREAMLQLIETLAHAVEQGDVKGYAQHSARSIDAQLEQGVAPILLLAASELFERVVLERLTLDQCDVVSDHFLAGRSVIQVRMQQHLRRVSAPGA